MDDHPMGTLNYAGVTVKAPGILLDFEDCGSAKRMRLTKGR